MTLDGIELQLLILTSIYKLIIITWKLEETDSIVKVYKVK